MPKKGYKLTVDERQRLSVSEKQFKNLIELGAKTIKEKAFCSLMIDSLSRRQVAEHLKFEHIDWMKNRFTRFEKYNVYVKRRWKDGVKESDKDYLKRRDEKIKKDYELGKIKQINTKNGKRWKKVNTGQFSNKTKALLLDLQDEFKTGHVFRASKQAMKSMSQSALSQVWNRCIDRHNRRIGELKMKDSYKIVHSDPNKRITLHDIRRTRPRNVNPKNKEEFQTVQTMLSHNSIKTTLDVYDKISFDKLQKTANDLFYKDEVNE